MRISLAAALTCFATVGTTAAADVQASMRKQTNIPAQQLGTALRTLAREREFQLIYLSDSIETRPTSGATGDLTVEEALTTLLSGSGLAFKYVDARTVSIFSAGAAPVGSATPVLPWPATGWKGMAETAPTRCADGYSGCARPARRFALFAAMLAAAQAGAQEQGAQQSEAQAGEGVLEEVTVTALKRRENAQTVPVTITALTAAELEKQGAVDYRDWSERVPGMTMYEDASANRRGGPTAVIRGVSQAGGGQLNEVSAQATTSYTFGQLPIFSSNIGLFDLDRLEILKGPQGTLFGIASMGGTVRYIPRAPVFDKFAAHATLDVGSFQGGGISKDLSFAANLPLVSDKLALRVSGMRRESDGYIDTLLLPLTLSNPANIRVNFGGEFDPRQRSGDAIIRDSNSSKAVGARAILAYQPLDRWTMSLTAGFQRNDQRNKQAVDYNDQSQDWVQSRFTLEPQNDELTLFSLESSFGTGIGSLEYVGGYFQRDLDETIDFTPLAPGQLNGTGANASKTALDRDGPGGLPPDPIPAATPFPFQTTSRMLSNELRLQGDHKPLFAGLTFDYVVGAFHMTEKREGTFIIANPLWNENRGPNTVPILTDGGLISGSRGGGDYASTAYFADLTLNVTRRFSVSAGVRQSDSSNTTQQHSWGDVISGKAANGATVGDNLAGTGSLTTVGPASAGTVSDKSVTPRASLKYAFNDDKMVYFTAAKGQRMPSGAKNLNYFGDLTGSSGLHPSCRPLARELGIEDDALNGTTSDTVWSYDLGFKSTWLDRRLLANIAVYYLDWADLQNTFQLSAINPLCLAVIPANVGAVVVKGAELQLTVVPHDSVTLNASVGYTDAGIKDTIVGLRDSLGQQLEKGDAVSNVAPWTAALSAEYRFPLTLLGSLTDTKPTGYARFDWRFRDERLGASLGDPASLRADPVRRMFISPAYTLMNFRVGTSLGDWSTALYVNNLANKRAVYGSYRQAWFPNTQMSGISPPRTIGLSLTRRF
jgi:outer membrane receptor protein involved in Fe transport